MKKEINIFIAVIFAILYGAMFFGTGYAIKSKTLNLNENFEKCRQLNGEYILSHNFKNDDHYEYCKVEEITRF